MKNSSEELIQHQKKLNEFINLVEKIEIAEVKEYISLPIICSMGNCGSGKTSVIENILNLEFLPKGVGSVTKRPIEISITHIKENSRPYAILEELGPEKLYDFSKLESKIDNLFFEINNSYENIEDKPLKLKLFSNNLPSITIVDLPSIYNSSYDRFEKFTQNITRKYILNESSIILCNIGANSDYYTNIG